MAAARMMKLFEHQKNALTKLRTGSILVGGVGSGKSLVGLKYYCQTQYPKKLYIITTAKKRDSHEWEEECYPFITIEDVVIDSWNQIKKYADVKDAFFIFDEQKVIGHGAWVKAFIKITKNNEWILLSATPGDTWMDYIPVFIANKFYKNRTEFTRRHVVYSRFTKFPKVDRYLEVGQLHKLRDSITVYMHYEKKTISHHEWVNVGYDKEEFNTVLVKRWNPFDKKPVKDVGELCYLMRKVVNSDPRRVHTVMELLDIHPKVIVFYNFDYELYLLLNLGYELGIPTAQWNGHKHEQIPNTEQWMYLVQYTAGAEGWNCIETNVVIFYSQNYSYKIMTQAAGRIDRLNTSFTDLYYYHLRSTSYIDLSIKKAYDNKRDFNEHRFLSI